ncbi:UDP-glucose 4-epimerase [Spirochaetia bacterium]|nr:UDP-glucose 4-epimerase [Spirochaetia bacterium]
MNLLIIGSTGFIGSHLFSRLSTKYNCYGADIINKENVNNYFLLKRDDVDYDNLFKNNHFDVCINASGAASVSESFLKPDYDMKLNVMNVEKILECIRKYQRNCHFITLSSAAVYGNPVRIPIKESDSLFPISPYGLHKMFSEEICKLYTNLFDIKTTCVRIFSAYGDGLKKQLLWDVLNKFLYEDEIEIYGSGNESRDFIHINDIVEAIALIINNVHSGFNIFNIANGEEIAVKYIVSSIKECLNSDRKIIFNNKNRAGDPLNWQADISKIRDLGYRKTVTIEQGIISYVSWAKCKVDYK